MLTHNSPIAAQPRSASQLLVLRATAVLFFVALTALAAQAYIPLPFALAPLTLQTLAVGVCAIALGPWLGSASMAIYVAIGVAGVPVFSGGDAGIQVLTGTTGGYIVGFFIAQAAIGSILRAHNATWGRITLAICAGYLTIFACAMLWHVLVNDLSLQTSFSTGVAPFLIGAVIKIAITVALAKSFLAARKTLKA